MTQQEHMIAWAIYLIACASFYFVFYRATAKLPFAELRQLLRILVAVFFLVPWATSKETAFLSPAWMVSLSDWLLYGQKAFWRAGLALILALILGLLVSTVWSLIAWRRARSVKPEPSQ